MKMKCLIVDDEPIAQDILQNFIGKVDFLELISKCNNAIDALQFLNSTEIDILFLDINMPVLSGLEMLKSLQKPPHIILTTAYSEFALQGYEFNVKDYLLKPFSFERFLAAINKVTDYEKHQFSDRLVVPKVNNNFIFFKADKKVYKLYYNEILFFEGCGNYVKVHSKNKKSILVLDKLRDLEEKFSTKNFLRVHKSFIVNLSEVREISGNIIYINEKEIPIGASYKENFWSRIKEN